MTESEVMRPDNRPRRRKFEAKLIVATSAAWHGEMYLRRDGASRHQFATFEQFCGALRAVTGWDEGLPRWLVQKVVTPPTAISAADASQRRLTRSATDHTSTGIKFVIAANRPWRGIAYRTNGSAKLSFDSFDQLVATTAKLTGWRILKEHRGRAESHGGSCERQRGSLSVVR